MKRKTPSHLWLGNISVHDLSFNSVLKNIWMNNIYKVMSSSNLFLLPMSIVLKLLYSFLSNNISSNIIWQEHWPEEQVKNNVNYDVDSGFWICPRTNSKTTVLHECCSWLPFLRVLWVDFMHEFIDTSQRYSRSFGWGDHIICVNLYIYI